MNEIMHRVLSNAMRPLVELVYKLEAKLAGKPHFEWGTVVSTDPLRVKLDSHTTPLPDRPDSLVNGLREGDRVRMERQGTRVTIHGVGNGGDTGWINAIMQNGWASNSGRPVRYRRVAGVVYLDGQADRTSMINSVIFTLPPGFRPNIAAAFLGASAGVDVGKVDVRANGEVLMAGAPAGRTYVMLSGIRFIAEG